MMRFNEMKEYIKELDESYKNKTNKRYININSEDQGKEIQCPHKTIFLISFNYTSGLFQDVFFGLEAVAGILYSKNLFDFVVFRDLFGRQAEPFKDDLKQVLSLFEKREYDKCITVWNKIIQEMLGKVDSWIYEVNVVELPLNTMFG